MTRFVVKNCGLDVLPGVLRAGLAWSCRRPYVGRCLGGASPPILPPHPPASYLTSDGEAFWVREIMTP